MGNAQKHFEYEGSVYTELKQNDRYGVSVDGVVVHRANGRVMPTESPSGYLFVTLNKNGRNQKLFVHRLVLEYFTDTYDPEFLYIHKDKNMKNNHVDNLEVARSQITNWRKKVSERGMHIPKAESVPKPVRKPKAKSNNQPIAVRCEETGEIFNSLAECAKAFGVGNQWMSKVMRSDNKTFKGYTFTVVDHI